MTTSIIYAMRVTRNNQYLVTGTTWLENTEEQAKEVLSGKNVVRLGGPVCVWSTKDLTLVKT